MISEREFDVLTLLTRFEVCPSQRKIAEQIRCSVGTANKLLKTCTEKGWCDKQGITEAGLQELEPYRVKRAIFIAAGVGARLAPITLNTPKSLIRVNGIRMIDTLLDAVVAAGIPEIVIVRGYLSEQFDQLLYKYPQIRFVENPLYNETNNIASAMCVRQLFQNAYVMDADLILKNPELIRTYEYRSNLLGIPVERTDDWCVQPDRNGFADAVSMGGIHGFQMVGIFYWNREDGTRLAEDTQSVYTAPGGKERYWEHTPLIYKKENYQVAIRTCCQEDVTEIDTLSELKQIDKTYMTL